MVGMNSSNQATETFTSELHELSQPRYMTVGRNWKKTTGNVCLAAYKTVGNGGLWIQISTLA